MMDFDPTNYTELKVRKTSIPGLLVFDLAVPGDDRGWFKENFQLKKFIELGVPEDFKIVQNNISFNKERGVTRGIHTEPWDKFISLGTGKVFVAIVDLRKGDTFGNVETLELTPGNAIFVPRGCGNSFQTLEPNTVYTYLVNDYWSPEAQYTMVNLADEDLDIEWPVPLSEAQVSEKDKTHPRLKDIKPLEL